MARTPEHREHRARTRRIQLVWAGIALPALVFASCTGGASSAGAGGGTATTGTGAATATGACFDLFCEAGLDGDPNAPCPDASPMDASLDASTGCEGLEAGVTFSGDVQPILLKSCQGEASCHSTPTYASTVGVLSSECCDGRKVVSPHDANHSHLANKITGTNICKGVPMPQGRPPLPAAEQLTILRWICEGAPKN